MIRGALGAILFFSFAAACVASGGRTPASNEFQKPPKALVDKLVAIEKQAWEDVKNHDLASYSRLLADDYVAIDEGGISDKATVLRLLKDLSISEYAMDGVKVTMLSPDAALLTYKATVKGTYQGSALGAQPYYYGAVFARRGGRWLAVSLQETRAK
jgi:ketosteroid isomerase-like protein